MTIKKMYTCDYCKTDFNTQEEAEACEQIHRPVDTISKMIYGTECPYPSSVTVVFDDGKSFEYKRY